MGDISGDFEEVPRGEFETLSQSQSQHSTSDSEYEPSDHTSQDSDSKVGSLGTKIKCEH